MTNKPRLTIEQQAAALATLLRESSPDRARDFVLGMHERACRDGDDHRMALWSAVLALVKQAASAAEAAPAAAPRPEAVKVPASPHALLRGAAGRSTHGSDSPQRAV